MKDFLLTMATFGFIAALAIVIIGPILTHVIWCINMAEETGSAIALLLVGLFIPPVGWFHGMSLWLGFTWI